MMVFLFDIIHSLEREVLCKRQVLCIAFFVYNGIVDIGFLPVQVGSQEYL